MHDPLNAACKRAFDIVGSLFLIMLTSPVMLIVALAIKLGSKGPLLFSTLDDGSPSHRVGEQLRLFHYVKFRTMRPGTHDQRYAALADRNVRKDGPLVKIKDDPRVTRIGKVLRAWSLDELPEFFLVLMGHMSLVGPRPHLPEEVRKYSVDQLRVLSVKPGITGPSQVRGRSSIPFDQEVENDVAYIRGWTFMTDVLLLLKTPAAVLKKRDAE